MPPTLLSYVDMRDKKGGGTINLLKLKQKKYMRRRHLAPAKTAMWASSITKKTCSQVLYSIVAAMWPAIIKKVRRRLLLTNGILLSQYQACRLNWDGGHSAVTN